MPFRLVLGVLGLLYGSDVLLSGATLIARSAQAPVARSARAADALPTSLSDREFWTLVNDLSEANGSFRSDNLLSNELRFQQVIPDLLKIAPPGRAYLGVGPEQNFTYIAALKPSIAFLVDIRRGNLDLHLLYKSLFELSSDRVEFVSLLFARPRPAGLRRTASVAEIFDAFGQLAANEQLYVETLAAVRNQLFTTHGFALSEEDLRGIEYVYRAFFAFGPRIQYSPIGLAGATVQPTYATLMTAADGSGQTRGFLASEDAFSFVKNLETRNLIVPLVGNFAGPKAIRSVGAYLKQKNAVVSAFYLSNVEEYLKRDGIWQDFCANVTELPVDSSSTYIRSFRSGSNDPSDGLRTEIEPMSQIGHCR